MKSSEPPGRYCLITETVNRQTRSGLMRFKISALIRFSNLSTYICVKDRLSSVIPAIVKRCKIRTSGKNHSFLLAPGWNLDYTPFIQDPMGLLSAQSKEVA
jgi:hypothetical protein